MTQTASESTTQKHYFLIAGNVVYKVDGGTKDTNPMGIITLNGLITSDTQTLGVTHLNEAQQVLQHHFRVKTEDNSIEIADVIILNVVYLGFQSENEFNNLNLTPVQ
jgi:actin-like ATPase involved in cell morphogenesis